MGAEVVGMPLAPVEVSPYASEAGETDFKPLTTEFIKECCNKTCFWAGYEVGRGEKLLRDFPQYEDIKDVPVLVRLVTNRLNYNFDPETNPFITMINEEFMAATGKICPDNILEHIFGNALSAFSGHEYISELKSENRQKVIDFLVQERMSYSKPLEKTQKLDPVNDSQYYYMIAKIRLACSDKLAELMLGKAVATQIAREAERGLVTDRPVV